MSGRGSFFGRVTLLGAMLVVVGCGGGEVEDEAVAGEGAGEDAAAMAESVVAGAGALPGGVAAPPPAGAQARGVTERDRQIFAAVMREAREERLDTLPRGEIIVRVGRRFVGYPYTPGTLETPGEERLVVNLREFDCVTYVETVLALARMISAGEDDFGTFEGELTRIRYRGGELDGYSSRLHYFSEWIADNEAKGLVREVTAELGGTRTDEPIDFMSSNAAAYPRLGDPAEVQRVRDTERRLTEQPRYYIPESRIGAVEAEIRNGDVIAATSSIEGLDIAHTGFAIWIDGRLHLMHAPLVGRSLEISELPLAERILEIEGQDGIMVARPL